MFVGGPFLNRLVTLLGVVWAGFATKATAETGRDRPSGLGQGRTGAGLEAPGLPTKSTSLRLELPGKVLHADERHLEFTDDPPEGA